MNPFEAFDGSINEYITNLAEQKRIPISGTFELLPFCNMRCEMCYIVHEKTEEYRRQLKSVDEWEAIIDQAIEEGMLYVLLTGGEPLLYPGIQDLLERLSKKPIHIFLNTNGTLINEESIKWLSKMRIARLNISLYGASDETYGKMCKNPKGFTQIINAFRLLKEYDIPFKVHNTLIPANYHEYEQIQQVCNEFGVRLDMVYYMFPPYRKDQGFVENHARFTPEEAAHVALRVLKDHIKDEKDLCRSLEANIACFDEPERYSLYGLEGITCKGGLTNFWVDWRGNVSGCGINNITNVNLFETSFKEAWPVVSQSVASIKASKECAYCKYRVICPVCTASAYTETGSVDGTPSYLCEFCEHYSKLLIEEHRKLKEKLDEKLL